MLKMDFKDGFEFLMRWKMNFKTQFDVKKEENERLWSEKEKEANGF